MRTIGFINIELKLKKKPRIGWEWGYLLVITKYSVVDQKVIAVTIGVPKQEKIK